MFPGMLNEMPVPAMGDKLKNTPDLTGYSVKYIKACIDDLTEMAALQSIETRGISGNGDIIILDRDKYVFMKDYFLIVHYLEKIHDVE